MTKNLLDLPDDLVGLILANLHLIDIYWLSSACWQFNNYVKTHLNYANPSICVLLLPLYTYAFEDTIRSQSLLLYYLETSGPPSTEWFKDGRGYSWSRLRDRSFALCPMWFPLLREPIIRFPPRVLTVFSPERLRPGRPILYPDTDGRTDTLGNPVWSSNATASGYLVLNYLVQYFSTWSCRALYFFFAAFLQYNYPQSLCWILLKACARETRRRKSRDGISLMSYIYPIENGALSTREFLSYRYSRQIIGSTDDRLRYGISSPF